MFPTPGQIVGSATVYQGKIYFGSQSGDFYAVNTDGSLACSAALGGSISTTPTVEQNMVVVSRDDGVVIGLDATNCLILWATPDLGLSISSPAIYQNVAMVSVRINTPQSQLVRIDMFKSVFVGSSPVFARTFTVPAVGKDQVFVGSDDPAHGIISFKPGVPAGPKFAIHLTISVGNEPVYGKPAVDYNLASPQVYQVYAVSGVSGKLYAFSGNGLPAWVSSSACGPLNQAASPTTANGGVYVGGQSCMNAFKTVTGAATWTLTIGALADSPASIADGILLFAALDNGGAERVFSY